MPYILVVLFVVAVPGAFTARVEHIDSIRFDDEKACRDAALWVRARIEGVSSPADPNTIRTECFPARSQQ